MQGLAFLDSSVRLSVIVIVHVFLIISLNHCSLTLNRRGHLSLAEDVVVLLVSVVYVLADEKVVFCLRATAVCVIVI